MTSLDTEYFVALHKQAHDLHKKLSMAFDDHHDSPDIDRWYSACEKAYARIVRRTNLAMHYFRKEEERHNAVLNNDFNKLLDAFSSQHYKHNSL
ncbi:MAG: hypothetical protein HOP36_01180 [Methyloglobulus sp.]|nr:hypothetical protein [Methyloglobulus sp.]